MKILSVIFFICSAVCAGYFVIITGYSGIEASYSWIWLIIAALFAAMGWFARSIRKNRGGMPRFLPTFVFTTFVMGAAVFAAIMYFVVSAAGTDDDRHPDYVVVLGARVYADGISTTLKYRLDKTLELCLPHPEIRIVLAGGQESGDSVPEAFAMYNYLSMKGIFGGRMLMAADSAGTSGVMGEAVEVLKLDTQRKKNPLEPGDMSWEPDYVPKVGIITSDFHMLRAVKCAEKNGVTEPIAIPVRSDTLLFVHNCVRESVAIVKDFFVGNITFDESEIPFIRGA